MKDGGLKVAKMVGFIKTCDKFNFGHFFSFIILPMFIGGNGLFPPALSDNDKNLAISFFFLIAIWLPHDQLRAIIEGTVSLTRC